jgi:hypothetical protein
MADPVAIGYPDQTTADEAADEVRRLAVDLIIQPDAIAEPTPGWTLVLRRQPVHLVEGRLEGGYTDAYELVCCDCGDNPDLDYRDVSPDLQRIRGPYRFSAGIEAYGQHDKLQHGQPPIPSASGTRRRTAHADGAAG